VVRRPAAVLTSPTVAALAGTVVAIAYFLLAGELDVSQDLRAEPRLHALAGCAAIAWCATVAGMAGVALVPAVLASLGGVLLIALLAAADVGAGASGVEALAATLPAFVALVALTGTGEAVLDARAATGDALGLTLPGWGAAPDAGALALTEPLFCGAFVALAARLGLRPAGTGLAVFLGLAAAVALDGLPPLTAMGVAFYVANADRLRTLVRDD
jgi:hypothetical protein